jgi:hypothetical protein
MTERTKVQTGAALYASAGKPAPLTATESSAIAKGRALYAARTTKGIQLETRQADDE